MFSANNNTANFLVGIKYARLVTGKYDWIEGEYRPVTWGSPQVMLKIEFSSHDNRINYFQLTNNGIVDYQHTTDVSQRVFFFPTNKLPSLQQLHIVGLNLTDNGGLRANRVVIGKSISIGEAVSITSKIINLIDSDKGLTYLQQSKIKLEQFFGKSDEEIRAELIAHGFAVKSQKKSAP